MKLATTLILATATILHAAVTVTVGEISDRRTTGEHFNGMEVKFKIAGPELAGCKGARVTIKESADDAGKPVKMQKRFGKEGGFEKLEKPFGGFDKPKDNEFEIKLELENPARAAKTLKLAGSLDLLVPANDPASIITASPAKEAGTPLANAAIKEAGAEITLEAPSADGLGYKIKDPGNKIAAVEFCSVDGKPLATNGTSRSSFGGSSSVSISFRDKPPADAVAKIYLLTEKSVLSVPLKLDAVTLP